jgi:hypothetical protein
MYIDVFVYLWMDGIGGGRSKGGVDSYYEGKEFMQVC